LYEALFFNFALEYTIRKAQENLVELKLNETHQLLVYADDVTLLADNTDTITKSTEALTDAIARTVLEDICNKPIRIQSYCAVARLHKV
jgi:hypothetical protein